MGKEEGSDSSNILDFEIYHLILKPHVSLLLKSVLYSLFWILIQFENILLEESILKWLRALEHGFKSWLYRLLAIWSRKVFKFICTSIFFINEMG